MKLKKTGTYWTASLSTIEPETTKRPNYAALGKIMLKEAGVEACQKGYGTTDPEWVGRYALAFGDIRPSGELN